MRRFSQAFMCCVTCGVSYFIVLEAFLAIPAFNGVTQIRPASGMSPVLGLLFGFPAALGCAIGNLVSDLIHWPGDPWLVYYFVVQLIYALGLRALWRITFQDDATPRLSSASRIAVFIIGSLLDSVLVTGLLMPAELDSMQALNIHAVRLLNNFLALVYVGTTLMLAQDRLHNDERERTLSERFAFTALCVTALGSILCVAAMTAFRGGEVSAEAGGFDRLVAQVYLALTAITICLFGLACSMLAIVERMLATPLYDLAVDARTLAARMKDVGPEQMRDGALDIELPVERVLGEIALVARESNEMRHALGASMIEAEASAREHERISTELNLASLIQANALPADFSGLERDYGVSMCAIMHPARTVGGDFYDVFALDDHRLCALVADVSDKGVPAALFMMRAMTEARECLRSAATLGEGLSHVNSHLCTQNDAMLFVTMFAVALNTGTGELEFANAGHNLPVLRSPIHGNHWLSARPGLPLGVLDDYLYTSGITSLLPGEGAVLYTDGVTEARSATGELFGDDRLMSALDTCGHDAACAVERLEHSVASFAQGAEQTDDLTVLSFSWLPSTVHAQFDAAVDVYDDVREFVHGCLSQTALESVGFEIDLIVEELFVNVATHAYEGSEPCDETVEIHVAEDEFNNVVHFVLQDHGIPYDPTADEARPLDGTEVFDSLRPGGMGILLVRRLSDSLRYSYLDGRNTLHVTKAYGI